MIRKMAYVEDSGQSALVRVPQKQIEKLKQLKSANASFCNKMLREPTDEEMANALRFSVEEIHNMKVLIPTFNHEEAGDRKNNIEVFPPDIYMRHKLYHDVDECMENLSDNKKGILLSRKDGVPLKNLAKSLDVAIETIRRWEKQAMKNMKDCLERKEWSIEDAIQVV